MAAMMALQAMEVETVEAEAEMGAEMEAMILLERSLCGHHRTGRRSGSWYSVLELGFWL